MLHRILRPLRRILSLLAPIAVVLLILFLIARSWAINHVRPDEVSAEAATTAVENLNAIVNISCENGNETLVFHQKEDGKWYWIDETFPLNQEAMLELSDTLASFAPSVEVDSGEELDLDQYDLSTPSQSLSYTTAGGETTTYYFGKVTDEGVCMKTGANNATVYMVPPSLHALAKKSLYDLCLTDSFPALSADNVSSFTVQGKENTVTYTRHVNEADSSVRWLSGSNDVTGIPAFKALLEELSGLSYDACLVWNPAEDSFKICGLDEPRLTVTVNYTDVNQRECALTLSIGDARNDEQYFAVWSVKNAIYSMQKTAVDALLAAVSAN